MPAHKRPAVDENDEKDPKTAPETQVKNEDDEENDKDGGEEEEEGDGNGSGSSSSEWEEEETDDNDPYVTVRLTDIRKEVQCPICLGIIRKTRTVMECLHRFCRECIDKSMRLGNNECPACRTHCASRRSLRDDPNYDALIAALYPDIDKYEEEELAFHEEDKSRNKKIQAYIAETFHRQSEALGRRKLTAKATATAFARRSQGNYRNHGQNTYLHGRGRSGGRDAVVAPSDDDEEEEANGNDGCKDSSSADEPSPDRRPKKRRRRVAPRSSPAMAAGNSDVGCEDNDDIDINRENNIGTSPLRTGSREMLAWGKNGTRSQTRHGNASGLNGRILKGGGRMTKLVEYLHNLNVNDDELDVPLTLIPLDKERTPNLEQPYLSCRPTLSIRHLCEYIARHISHQAEEIQIYSRENQGGHSTVNPFNSLDVVSSIPLTGLKVLGGQESLAMIYPSSAEGRQGLELLYHLKGKAKGDA